MEKILEPVSEDIRNVNLDSFLLHQEELSYEYPVQTSPLLLMLCLSNLIDSSIFEFVVFLPVGISRKEIAFFSISVIFIFISIVWFTVWW